MKKFTKKILAVLLLFLMIVQAAPSTVAHAASPSIAKNLKVWLHHNGEPKTVRFTIKNPVKNGKNQDYIPVWQEKTGYNDYRCKMEKSLQRI